MSKTSRIINKKFLRTRELTVKFSVFKNLFFVRFCYLFFHLLVQFNRKLKVMKIVYIRAKTNMYVCANLVFNPYIFNNLSFFIYSILPLFLYVLYIFIIFLNLGFVCFVLNSEDFSHL